MRINQETLIDMLWVVSAIITFVEYVGREFQAFKDGSLHGHRPWWRKTLDWARFGLRIGTTFVVDFFRKKKDRASLKASEKAEKLLNSKNVSNE